jgi:inner membrane protein
VRNVLFQTHVLIGIIFFIIFRGYFAGDEIIVLLLILLGSILPDLDSPTSIINKWSGIFGRVVSLFTKHRGLFHSMVFHLALFVVLQQFISITYARALFLGYLAHIVGDGITPAGITLFYPFSKFKIRGPVKVGSYVEVLLFIVLVVLVVISFM